MRNNHAQVHKLATLPSIQDLQAFEAAARRLSFLHAAEELNVTAGAISRRLKSLEDYLGTPLFDRFHKRVELTTAGRTYLADIVDVLTRLEAASARVRARPAPHVVSVCVYPTFAFRWLIPRWARFHDAHPDVDVRLTTSLNPVDFDRDDYDLVIKVSDMDSSGGPLRHERLLDVRLFPVCSPVLARQLNTPKDLAAVTLLHGAPRPADWQRWLELVDLGEAASGIDAKAGLTFDSSNLAFQAAAEGLGVAIGIDVLVADDLAQGRLVQPFPQVRDSNNSFVLAYPVAKAEAPALQHFRAWLLDEAGRSAPDSPLR